MNRQIPKIIININFPVFFIFTFRNMLTANVSALGEGGDFYR